MTMNNNNGKVIQLYITKDDAEKTRLKKECVTLDEQGVKEDKFYAKESQRAILITSKESYELAQKNDIDILDGVLGENILIDINPYGLLPGDKLQIGNALLEITQNCTLCKGLTSVNAKLPKLLKDDRGIFAKALNEAKICINDSVTFLNKQL